MTSDIVFKYFPDLTTAQQQQYRQLPELYQFWNSQINVISRKDIDLLFERHVLHSLGIAKVMTFLPGERVLDVGTGGGFPGRQRPARAPPRQGIGPCRHHVPVPHPADRGRSAHHPALF